MKEADKLRTRLLAEADSLKVARTKSTLGALLDRWLPQHEDGGGGVATDRDGAAPLWIIG